MSSTLRVTNVMQVCSRVKNEEMSEQTRYLLELTRQIAPNLTDLEAYQVVDPDVDDDDYDVGDESDESDESESESVKGSNVNSSTSFQQQVKEARKIPLTRHEKEAYEKEELVVRQFVSDVFLCKAIYYPAVDDLKMLDKLNARLRTYRHEIRNKDNGDVFKPMGKTYKKGTVWCIDTDEFAPRLISMDVAIALVLKSQVYQRAIKSAKRDLRHSTSSLSGELSSKCPIETRDLFRDKILSTVKESNNLMDAKTLIQLSDAASAFAHATYALADALDNCIGRSSGDTYRDIVNKGGIEKQHVTQPQATWLASNLVRYKKQKLS